MASARGDGARANAPANGKACALPRNAAAPCSNPEEEAFLRSIGSDGLPCRLGILGGTFDPIHNGHIEIARCASRALGLCGVLFVVAGDPWMKHGRAVTPAENRLAMVRAALAGEPRFAASCIEIDRAGETYACDTLRELRERLPENVELVFLLGADAAEHLSEWHDAESLGGLARFAVVSKRPGSAFDAAARARAAQAIGAPSIDVIDMPPMDVSSTDLRENVRAGRSIEGAVPAVVADYVQTHRLYR